FTDSEFLHFASKLGDDQLGSPAADSLELHEWPGIPGLNGLGDLADRDMQGLEGGFDTDPFDGGKSFEKPLVVRAEKTDQPGLEVTARCIPFQIEDGVKSNLPSQIYVQFCRIGRGYQQLVEDRPAL